MFKEQSTPTRIREGDAAVALKYSFGSWNVDARNCIGALLFGYFKGRQHRQELLGSHRDRHQALDQVHDRVGAALFAQEIVRVVDDACYGDSQNPPEFKLKEGSQGNQTYQFGTPRDKGDGPKLRTSSCSICQCFSLRACRKDHATVRGE